MKRILQFLKSEKWLLMSLVTLLVSIFMCSTGVVMAEVATVAGGTPTASAGQTGESTQVPGEATTVSNAKEAGDDLIQPDIDKDITKIASDENVLDTIKRKVKRQVRVTGFEVDHYVLDEKRTFGTTTAKLSSGTGETFALTMSAADAKLFSDYRTAIVQGMKGYAANGSTRTDALLMLYCVGKNDSGMPKFFAVNGPKTNTTDTTCTTPEIASGSKIILLSTACYETQTRVSPNTVLPSPQTVYLQKQICNSVVSDYFDAQKKRIPFAKAQIAESAIREFRLENDRTAWIGIKSKFKVEAQDKNMGSQYVYTTEGIRWQIKRSYELVGNITMDDIVNLSKFKFTGTNCSKRALWIIGSQLLADIQKIDFALQKDISMADDEVWGIKCRKLKTVFGDIDLIYDPVLDRIGYEKCGALLDEQGLVRYWMKNEETKTEKVEGEEAKRDIVMCIDALCLKGYSHVWVDGTGVEASTTNTIQTVAALPTSPKANDVIILSADVADTDWKKGDILQYDGTKWAKYDGTIAAVA